MINGFAENGEEKSKDYVKQHCKKLKFYLGSCFKAKNANYWLKILIQIID